MLKKKYLHRKERNTTYHKWNYRDLNSYEKNINLFSDLPTHQSIRRCGYSQNCDTTPLREFLYSKIGENWNDVYSEIIKKTKPKFRYEIDFRLKYNMVMVPIYDDDFIPRDERGYILSNFFFIDMNNILVIKNKQDLLYDAKKYKRKIKLEKILESLEKENQENQ